MKLPHFLGLGAAKAGTTSLRHYLIAHPDVFVVRAEPRFFASENQDLDSKHPSHHQTVTNLNDYMSLFDGVTTEKVIGEISPAYLHSTDAPQRIKHYVPEVKLFAILRNPVDRAFAHYMQMVKSGAEPITDFSEALNSSKEYVSNGWVRKRFYLDFGFYYEQLNRYYKLFSKNNIKVFLLDDLKENPKKLAQDLYSFIGVDKAFLPDFSINYNPGGIPKNRTIQRLLSQPNKYKTYATKLLPKKAYQELVKLRLYLQNKNLRTVTFPEELREPLIGVYQDDITRLQDLINRDLSSWLK